MNNQQPLSGSNELNKLNKYKKAIKKTVVLKNACGPPSITSLFPLSNPNVI